MKPAGRKATARINEALAAGMGVVILLFWGRSSLSVRAHVHGVGFYSAFL